jgi:thiol-disulfide isomerase/thioredoxin
MHKLFCVAVLIGSVLLTGLFVQAPGSSLAASEPALKDFKLFPEMPEAGDFKMGSLDGRTFRLSDFKGKLIILNFWRSNCPHCEVEKGLLKTLQDQMKGLDVQVVCVNLWDDPSWVLDYEKKNGKGLLLAIRPDNQQIVVENKSKGRVAGYFVVNEGREAIYEVNGFPSTYIIKDGRVVGGHLGMAKWNEPAVMKYLAQLAGSPIAAPRATRGEDELPAWIDEMLSFPVPLSGSGGGDSRRAYVAPNR